MAKILIAEDEDSLRGFVSRALELDGHEVDQAVSKLLREAEQRAEAIITEHRDGLKRLVAALEAEETLSREAIADCLVPPDMSRAAV